MRKFIFLMLGGVCAIRATSFSSATCTLGSTIIRSATTCSIPFVLPDGTSGSIEADAMVLPGSSVSADAGIGPPGILAVPFTWSASGSASYDETDSTAGPRRPGVIGFFSLLAAFGEHGGSGSAAIGPYGTGPCNLPVCTFGGPELFPFELGTPFTISLSASAAGPCGPDGCPEGGASIPGFFLLEADGTTPVPFFVVPEPSTLGLLLLSLAACAGFYPARPKGGGLRA